MPMPRRRRRRHALRSGASSARGADPVLWRPSACRAAASSAAHDRSGAAIPRRVLARQPCRDPRPERSRIPPGAPPAACPRAAAPSLSRRGERPEFKPVRASESNDPGDRCKAQTAQMERFAHAPEVDERFDHRRCAPPAPRPAAIGSPTMRASTVHTAGIRDKVAAHPSP